VHIDRHESADLLEDVVLVDKRIAYVEATEVGADCVHDCSLSENEIESDSQHQLRLTGNGTAPNPRRLGATRKTRGRVVRKIRSLL
jgi:hypothetical protein